MTRSEFNMKELEYDELKKEDTFFGSEDVNIFLNELEDKVNEIKNDLELIKSVKDLYIIEEVLESLQNLSKELY